MKIATWNINSIRARIERLCNWLESAQPDVLCLQELKCTEEQFPRAEIEAAGYHAQVFGQKTYNGVAFISKEPLTDVTHGLNDGVDDPESRLISGVFKGIRLFNLYAPNGQEVGSPAYQSKLQWYARLTRLLTTRHTPTEPLLLCGDFNVAPEDLDVWDARYFSGHTLFTVPERDAFKKLKDALGLVDMFRTLHPDLKAFSWWDYRLLAFPRNNGLRIDHFLMTPGLAARCKVAEIDREARKGKLPSDHAPVWVDVEQQ